MVERSFGHIPGYPIGATFETRKQLALAGVHRPLQAGISGSGKEGCDSIVLSGGYEDDKDDGDVIIYTGQGGRDQAENKSKTRNSHEAIWHWQLVNYKVCQ